jgi:hypothetical protein
MIGVAGVELQVDQRIGTGPPALPRRHAGEHAEPAHRGEIGRSRIRMLPVSIERIRDVGDLAEIGEAHDPVAILAPRAVDLEHRPRLAGDGRPRHDRRTADFGIGSLPFRRGIELELLVDRQLLVGEDDRRADRRESGIGVEEGDLLLETVGFAEIVCVHPRHEFALHGLQERISRSDDALVSTVGREDLDPLVARGELLDEIQRAIGRAIVLAEQGEIAERLIKDAADSSLEIPFAIVDRHQDRETRHDGTPDE